MMILPVSGSWLRQRTSCFSLQDKINTVEPGNSELRNYGNYGTIFPFLLKIYLQLMLLRRLLKLIYFKRHFPAIIYCFYFFYKEGFVNRILKNY